MTKLGLALGSGGVRGFAHLGVIEVLEQEGIPIDAIAGSSAGAAVGAMYAFRPKLAPCLTQVRHYLNSELYDNTKLGYLRQTEETRQNFYDKMKVRLAQGAVFATSVTKNALFTEEVLRTNVEYLIPPVNIEESLIPLSVVTFDLSTGREIILREGPLVPAIMASCAIPGVFPPVAHGDYMLMDGGIIDPVPVAHTRDLGADLVVGVDVAPLPDALKPLGTSYEVAMRAADISRFKLKTLLLREADLVINVPLNDVFWADFSQLEHCVEAGREAAREALPRIREALGHPVEALPSPATSAAPRPTETDDASA